MSLEDVQLLVGQSETLARLVQDINNFAKQRRTPNYALFSQSFVDDLKVAFDETNDMCRKSNALKGFSETSAIRANILEAVAYLDLSVINALQNLVDPTILRKKSPVADSNQVARALSGFETQYDLTKAFLKQYRAKIEYSAFPEDAKNELLEEIGIAEEVLKGYVELRISLDKPIRDKQKQIFYEAGIEIGTYTDNIAGRSGFLRGQPDSDVVSQLAKDSGIFRR